MCTDVCGVCPLLLCGDVASLPARRNKNGGPYPVKGAGGRVSSSLLAALPAEAEKGGGISLIAEVQQIRQGLARLDSCHVGPLGEKARQAQAA